MRRWEREGLLQSEKTLKGHRRYDPEKLPNVIGKTILPAVERKTCAYARVSTKKQEGDLERQKQSLEMFCAARGWTFEMVADIGSGLNHEKKGLRKVLADVMAGKVERLVVSHKDRLLRFGAELIFALCEAKHCEVVVMNAGENATFEEDLARDVLEIITVFSEKLYGRGSSRAKRIVEKVEKALADEVSGGKA